MANGGCRTYGGAGSTRRAQRRETDDARKTGPVYADPVLEALNNGTVKDLRAAFNEAFWRGKPVKPTGEMLVGAFELGREDMARLLVTYGARPDDAQLEKIMRHCDAQGRDRKHALRILATGGVYVRTEDYEPVSAEPPAPDDDARPTKTGKPALTATQQAALDDLYAELSNYYKFEHAIWLFRETQTPLSAIDPAKVIDASPGFTQYPALSNPYAQLLKDMYREGADFSGVKPDELVARGDAGAAWILVEMGAAGITDIDAQSVWRVMPDMSETGSKTDAHRKLLCALKDAGVPPDRLHPGASEVAGAHGIEGIRFLVENGMAGYRDFDPWAVWKKTPDMTMYPALSSDYARLMRNMKKQGADFSRVAEDVREHCADNPGAQAFFMEIGVLSPRDVKPVEVVRAMARQRGRDRYSYNRLSSRDAYIRLLDILKDKGVSMAAVNPAWYYAQTGDAERATALMEFNGAAARDVSPGEILQQVPDVERYSALSADHLKFIMKLADAGMDFTGVDLRGMKLKNPGLAKFMITRGYCRDKPDDARRFTGSTWPR